MSQHPIHDVASAPAASRPILEGAQKQLGFVPNLFGVLADAPAALQAYTAVSEAFDRTSFTPLQRQVVLLAASVLNECSYCVAAHSTTSDLQKLDRDVVDALRAGRELPDAKLEALARFTRAVVEQRGFVDADETARFLAAGHTPAQVLEVVLGVGMKTLSNYTNHLVDPPLDEAFAPRAWERPALAG